MTTSVAIFGYTATPSAVPYGSGPVTLLLAVGNATGSFKACSQIQFTVPDSLATNPSSITPTSLAPNSWAFTTGSSPNTFVANPLAGTTGLKNGDSIGLLLSGIDVVAETGLAEIQVDEYTNAGLGQAWIKVTTVPPGLAITQFSANSLEIVPGQTVTLNWATTNASSVTLSYGGTNMPVGANGPSVPIPLQQTTTFTLTASGTGPPAVEQLVINVEQVQVTKISANPTDVALSGNTTISWEAVFAESFLLEPDDVPIPGTQNSIVHPVNDPPYTVFVLTANGAGDTNAQASAGVNVKPVQITTFTTKPQQVPIGSNSSLVWDTEWASSCSISPDPGFAVGTSGQGPISSPPGQKYTLNADGYQQQTAVTQQSFGPIITSFGFTVDPQQPDTAQLNWASSGGASATLQAMGLGNPTPTKLSGTAPCALQDGYRMQYRIVVTDSAGTTVTVEMDFAGLMTGSSGTLTSVQVNCPTGINVAGETVTISWAADPPQKAAGMVEYYGSSKDEHFYQATPPNYSTQLLQTGWSGSVGIISTGGQFVQWWLQPQFGRSQEPAGIPRPAADSIAPLISRLRSEWR